MNENIDIIKNKYFEWLYWFVCRNRANKYTSYKKIFELLHDIEFDFYVENDMCRAVDGIDLRRHFILIKHYEDDILDILDGPCTVLEMMVALAIRIEEIKSNYAYGDRTRQWFWTMMSNLGLGIMTDDIYDEKEAIKIIYDFMERRYEPDGRGGLFYVRNCPIDMSQSGIWEQMCAFLNKIG